MYKSLELMKMGVIVKNRLGIPFSFLLFSFVFFFLFYYFYYFYFIIHYFYSFCAKIKV